MTLYITTAEFWRNGVAVPVGSEIELSDKQSKYLKHALIAKADADAARAALIAAVAKARVAEDLDEEKPVTKPAKRAKKLPVTDDGDAR